MSPAFACDINVLDEPQRKRHSEITASLFQTVSEIKDIKNGYAFLLPATSDNLLKTAEFISLERLCCPFFRFKLELLSGNKILCLYLTGENGIKPFIKAEIGGHLNHETVRFFE